MAANIRCLGENAKPDAAAQSKSELCFHDLKTENNDLEAQVRRLKSGIDLADPHWVSGHAEAHPERIRPLARCAQRVPEERRSRWETMSAPFTIWSPHGWPRAKPATLRLCSALWQTMWCSWCPAANRLVRRSSRKARKP